MPNIDLFTPETMDGVVRVMPEVSTFFKDTFFKTTKPQYTEDVRVEFVKGTRKIAPFVNLKGLAKNIEKRGYSTETFTTPAIKVQDTTTIEDMVKRLPGELLQNSGVTPYQRGVELLAEQMSSFEEMITRREEWMCVQAMMTGKIPVKGDNVDYEIDFGFTHKVTPAVAWDSKDGTPTPLTDLRAAVQLCQKDGYKTPDICIMERSAYDAFIDSLMASGMFKNRTDIFDVLTIKPERRQYGVTYAGRLRDPDLDVYIYEEYVLDDWTNPKSPKDVSLMPKGSVLVASTNARYSMYYGLMVFIDPVTRDFRQVFGTRAADSWINKNPDARFVSLNSRPLPVPHEVDSWAVLSVLTTD